MQSIDRTHAHTRRSIVIIDVLLVLSLVLVLGVFAYTHARESNNAHVPVSTNTPACYEDMPCWDCATMGNLICGPVD